MEIFKQFDDGCVEDVSIFSDSSDVIRLLNAFLKIHIVFPELLQLPNILSLIFKWLYDRSFCSIHISILQLLKSWYIHSSKEMFNYFLNQNFFSFYSDFLLNQKNISLLLISIQFFREIIESVISEDKLINHNKKRKDIEWIYSFSDCYLEEGIEDLLIAFLFHTDFAVCDEGKMSLTNRTFIYHTK